MMLRKRKKEIEIDNKSGYMLVEDEIMEERNGIIQNTREELQIFTEDYDNEVKQDDAKVQCKCTTMEIGPHMKVGI